MSRAVSSSADAEAAAWIARLHGDSRSPALEEGLKAWLEADPAHGDAFERATEVWTLLPGAALCSAAEKRAAVRPRVLSARSVLQPRRLALAASVLLVAGLALLLWLFIQPGGYATGIGEQKVATLEDGSRIALNTDSKLEVRYTSGERLIDLDRGEAMFEVAHNPRRPFIVRAGGKQVEAVGTVFIVRRDSRGVTVTLVQGKVRVTDLGNTANAAPTLLAPGERLKAPLDAPARIDQQPAEAATAWRRGQALFDETPLADAANELNRYGGPQLSIEDTRLASLPVSGVFATNDTEEFAQAVAGLHGLRVEKRGRTLHIVR